MLGKSVKKGSKSKVKDTKKIKNITAALKIAQILIEKLGNYMTIYQEDRKPNLKGKNGEKMRNKN